MLRGIPCFSIFKQLALIYLNQGLVRYSGPDLWMQPGQYILEISIIGKEVTEIMDCDERLKSLIYQQATKIMDCDGTTKKF
ncbi:hypothetical protein BHE74_00012412 [Ensete ventricosum]|nr:hypothetical protein BHE74_00012412 [Ensete ventricosum]RZR90805.1 hypothetical protein BHM03_00018766 [Ensete ventricosum]